MENITVLPYLRIYFRGLNAIRKSCFETLHTTSCVTRTALDRLGSDAGRFWHTAKKNAAVCGHTILLLSRLPVQKAISAYDLQPNVSVVSQARQ